MRIFFIADIFGPIGKRVLAERLEKFIAERSIDVCVANAENIAGGHGVTGNLLAKLHKFGVNVVTGGNHSFANQDCIGDYATDPHFLRPHNFPPGNPGKGKTVFTLADGRALGILNLQGRVFFSEHVDCPFRAAASAVEELSRTTKAVIVDFHAEATSEKKALFSYLDGKVSALIGTHTHVQTADEIISPLGTAYITDAGLTGPEDSAIGMKTEGVLRRFLLQTPVRFEPSEKGPMLNGVVIDVSDETGRAESISRVYERMRFA
jgi:2',3'-cyclic-nucleotide 2'-phosphodiesterase